MTDAITPITADPDPATPSTFATQADLAWAQIKVSIADMNIAFAAMNVISLTDSSATSNSIGLGSKVFTVTAGKSFVAGQYLNIVDTAAPTTNAMLVQVDSYSSTTLTVSCVTFKGSGTKTAWTISLSASPYQLYAGASILHLHTGNGHGSTNNKIRRMTTTVTNTGAADWTYADTAADGGSITFVRAGLYSAVYFDINGSAEHGLSLNSNQLTTAYTSITETHKLATAGTAAAGGCGVVFYAAASQVLRMHTDGTMTDTAAIGRFRLERLM